MHSEAVNEVFRHYRQSGIAYSITLISLCSGLIVWTSKILPGLENACMCLSIVMTGFAGATVIVAVAVQLFNYFGYKCQAQAEFQQRDFAEAIRWFDREDKAIKAATACFVLAIICACTLFIMLL
jgi:hypothetical protein